MTVREASWLRDAYNLIYYYRSNEAIRERINTTFLYNNRPVFFYVEALVRFSPKYFGYYRQVFQREIGYFNSRATRMQWRDILPTRLWDFFNRCAADSGEYNRVLTTISSPGIEPQIYNEQQIRRLAAAEAMANFQQRNALVNNFLNQQSQTREVTPRAESIKKLEIEEEKEKPEEELEEKKSEEEETTQPSQPPPAAPPSIPPGISVPNIPSGMPTFARETILRAEAVTARLETGARGMASLTRNAVSGLLRLGGSGASGLGRLAIGAGARGVTALAAAAGGISLAGVGLAFAIALIFILIVVMIPVIMPNFFPSQALFGVPGLETAQAGPITGGGGSCPDQATINANKNANTCHYLGVGVNLFDTNISQSAIDTYINHYSSIFTGASLGDTNEFRRRVGLIISKAQSVGLNPVIFLGYWKTESYFGTLNAATFGCAPGQGVKPFETELNCAVGLTPDGNAPGGALASRCASPRNANKQGCGNLRINTFDDFAESYGSKSVDINNCTHTYNMLIEVAEELGACLATPAGGGVASSCPLDGTRTISCGSFMSDPKYNRNVCKGAEAIARGHCGKNYGDCYTGSINSTLDKRRAHSIDVNAGAGETVKLPTINGQVVQWSFTPSLSYNVTDSEGGGYGNVFTAKVGGDSWVLHLLHTNQTLIPPPVGRGYQSGDQVTTIAQTSFTHLHINIGKNPSGPNGGSGWLNPEDLGMCTK